MNLRQLCLSSVLLCCVSIASCTTQSSSKSDTQSTGPDLVGQWRTTIQFSTGAFAALNDLQFMSVFNSGGTMTESSNYDVAPPVPPAYGIWKNTGPNQFEAKYEFFLTQYPIDVNEITRGSGWLPAGHGVLTEKITLATDGNSYTSSIRYDAYDKQGNLLDAGGDGTANGVKLRL